MGRKGLPKAYIKKWGVTKLAWKKFRAKALSKSKPRKAKTTRKKTNPIRRRRNLARRRKRRRKKSLTIPLAPIAGVLGSPAVGAAINGAMAGNFGAVAYEAGRFVGINAGKFDLGLLLTNVTPIVAGLLVHKFVGGAPLNLNRTLASAGVPIIRI